MADLPGRTAQDGRASSVSSGAGSKRRARALRSHAREVQKAEQRGQLLSTPTSAGSTCKTFYHDVSAPRVPLMVPEEVVAIAGHCSCFSCPRCCFTWSAACADCQMRSGCSHELEAHGPCIGPDFCAIGCLHECCRMLLPSSWIFTFNGINYFGFYIIGRVFASYAFQQ